MEKIYSDKQGQARFRCPFCGFTRSFDASSYKDKDSRISIKCQCGQTVPILVEFREHYRKDVDLPGECLLQRLDLQLPVRIKNLSQQGAGFIFEARPNMDESISFQKGDVMLLSFQLDDTHGHLVRRRATVVSVKGLYAGSCFVKSEYDKELGFYLMK